MDIQCLQNEELSKRSRSLVITTISAVQDEPQKMKKLQSLLFKLLEEDGGEQERSILVICDLYKAAVWVDNETAEAICNACLHNSPRIAKVVSLLLLEFGKEVSSSIFDQMPKGKLLKHLEKCPNPDVQVILLRVYALIAETPVISEHAIRRVYVELSPIDQEEAAQLLAETLRDFHLENSSPAQRMFNKAVSWFFKDKITTKKSTAAGLLFIKKACNVERKFISDKLEKKLLAVANLQIVDFDEIIKSARELIDLIKTPAQMPQIGKRKKEPKKEKSAKRRKVALSSDLEICSAKMAPNEAAAPPPSSKPAKSGGGKQKKKKRSEGKQKEKIQG